MNDSEEFPKRMIAKRIILHAFRKARTQEAIRPSCPHLPAMEERPVRERLGLPPLHSRTDQCEMIDATLLQRCISADFLIALPSEQLARPRYILVARKTVVVRRVAGFLKCRSGYS